jgi:cobyrinic acid a,c-diamide synthase
VTTAGAPGLVVAAPASGSGKTTVTLGLLRHLRRLGVGVASAKVGPDYIDPAFHAAASGAPCLNLDPWAMRPSTLAALIGALSREAGGADGLVVCEGVMGLFDGAGPAGDEGSTADLAAFAGWPVVLVVDARGQSASAAALLRGFAAHRADIRVAGVIFNRVGGERHASMLRAARAKALPGLSVLGMLPRDEGGGLALPSRHLGLVQAREHPDIERFLDIAADRIAAAIDIEGLLRIAAPTHLPPPETAAAGSPPVPPLGQRMAIADDAAFAFAYPHLLDGWRKAGAELRPFAPLADEAPDAEADAVFLPGGYAELHAGRLAANGRFLDGLRGAAARGATVYGECGGYMALGEGLIDARGERHAMAGLLPLVTSFAERRLHLGYRHVRLIAGAAVPLGAPGAAFGAHEFHYSTVVTEGPGAPLFHAENSCGVPLGPAGLVSGRVAGSYLHLVDRR